jgi:CBS domain-containing protein
MATNFLVRDFMSRNVKTVKVTDIVKNAVKKMNKFNIGSVIVMDSNMKRAVGILTERDILRLVDIYPEPGILKVQNVMSSPIETITPFMNIEEAVKLMSDKNIKKLPVIENGQLIGIITSYDITKANPKLIKNI